MYNLMSFTETSAIIRLSKSSTHYLEHHLTAINNLQSVVFEPYDSSKTVDDDSEYADIDRVSVIINDQGLSLSQRTTQFNLLSFFEMDKNIIRPEEGIAQSLIERNSAVSLPIIRTAVTFKNLRMENLISNRDSSEVVFLHAFKLEQSSINFEKVDFRLKGTFFQTLFPMNFYASEILIIDYVQAERGFIFQAR